MVGLKTFDTATTVKQVRLFNVYDKLKDPAVLYQKAVDKGLLQ